MAGHTLAMYRRLPFGWRTTPPNQYTDLYMWQQFLDQPECRVASGYQPTIIYMPRYPQQDWSAQRRLPEVMRWYEQMMVPGWYETFLQGVFETVARDRVAKARALRRWEEVGRRIRRLPAIGWLARAALRRLERKALA